MANGLYQQLEVYVYDLYMYDRVCMYLAELAVVRPSKYE